MTSVSGKPMSVPPCPTARSLLPPHLPERRALQILQRQLGITETETQIVYLLPLGLTVKEVACRTNRAPSTVKGHLEHATRRTGTANTRELASLVTAVLWWASEEQSGE
jgi:DNA-binding NarL/FixJ family response regulator